MADSEMLLKLQLSSKLEVNESSRPTEYIPYEMPGCGQAVSVCLFFPMQQI